MNVTLLPLPKLEAQQPGIAQTVAELRSRAQSVGKQAGDRLEHVGQLLLQRRGDWKSDLLEPAVLDKANRLSGAVEIEGRTAGELRSRAHRGVKGLFGGIGSSAEANRHESARSRAALALRPLLMQIAHAAPIGVFEVADRLRNEAHDLHQHAAALTQLASVEADLLQNRKEEIKRREGANQRLGFDYLYTAGLLTTNGLRPVSTSFILKRGEQAYFSTPAHLVRHKAPTRIAAGSHALSSLMSDTGIRYRVGTFRATPVSQEDLATLDRGTLVLTNQRIVFIGALKSLTCPLERIMNVDSYKDGIALFKEGRENADLFLCQSPLEFLMYLNHLLEHRSLEKEQLTVRSS